MAEATGCCPCCGQNKERIVVPFNSEEGVETVCAECFDKVPPWEISFWGRQELKKLDDAGYFSSEADGRLVAIIGQGAYIDHLKLGRPKPFNVTGSLIIANQCSS